MGTHKLGKTIGWVVLLVCISVIVVLIYLSNFGSYKELPGGNKDTILTLDTNNKDTCDSKTVWS